VDLYPQFNLRFLSFSGCEISAAKSLHSELTLTVTAVKIGDLCAAKGDSSEHIPRV
jgi:hypothetical protein